MTVKWVYENVTGFDAFYSKLNIVLLITSLCLWKKYHPRHTTVLYVDKSFKSINFINMSLLNIKC